MTFARLRVWIVALLACAVVGAGGCASLDVKQREVIFRPEKDSGATPADFGLAFEDVWLSVPRVEGEGNERVHGWWIPAGNRDATGADAPSVLYLHGTRWSISGNLFRIARWQRMGFNVLAIDYRGFGQSDGALPSEAQSYADAQAAWDELRRREPMQSRRLVFGHSLGGAVAIELATRTPDMAGLVVESSFTSILDMAETTRYGFLPVGLILTQRFDSLAKVPKLGVPVLYIHGAADRWVPPSMSERLHAASPGPKRLVLVEGGGHSNVSGVNFDLYRREILAFTAASGGLTFAGSAAPAAAD